MAVKLSIEKALAFLDDTNLNWTRQRKCGSCHTNYPYLMSRPLFKDNSPAAQEIRAFFENRSANWDSAKPRWDTEVVATAVGLAINDARSTGKLHDDYFGVTYAALGVGLAPDDYAHSPSAEKGIEKLRGYLKKNAAPDLHHRAMLLWASLKLDGLLEAKERDVIVKNLLALQRADGGWSLPALGNYARHQKDKDGKPLMNDKNAPSDGYGTGFVVYVLRQAGLPADNVQIRKGIDWLSRNQRASGRWFTRSLNTDSYHFISHAGTAFAVMALEACK